MDALTLDVEHAKEALTGQTAFTASWPGSTMGPIRAERFISRCASASSRVARGTAIAASRMSWPTKRSIASVERSKHPGRSRSPPARCAMWCLVPCCFEDIRRERRYVHIEEARVATGSGCCGGATDDTAAADEQRLSA